MIDLPRSPAPMSADLTLVGWGASLTPSLGGPVQRVIRMGSRFRLSVILPPIKGMKVARVWQSRLIQGMDEGVRMRLPLLDFDPGAPGVVKVSGSGQAGSTLNVKGATPNYVFREGQFFSIETGGKHHLYPVATETIASDTGTASIPLGIMLRRPHLDNDLCHFGVPMIEGFLSGDELTTSLAIGRFISLSFDIFESQ